MLCCLLCVPLPHPFPTLFVPRFISLESPIYSCHSAHAIHHGGGPCHAALLALALAGATPTISSTSITFYDQPIYTITPTTFTMRLEFNACTTLPASAASKVWSTWRLDGAPGGLGECVSLNQYEQEGCIGTYTSSPSASDGTSMTGLGFT
ncbi:unnamed protein product [Closterium sp. NIES-53]